jgi:hypothetical protein
MTDSIRGVQLVGNDGYDRFPKTYGSLVKNADGDTLENVEANAQENVIETIKINGTAVTVSQKSVNLLVYSRTEAEATFLQAADIADKADISDVYTKDEVDAKMTSAYTPKGSVAFANLPALSAANLNCVYNVTDSFTTTSSFVEGAGKSYPAGTQVAIVNTGTASSPVYKYDAFSGFVDLSSYDSHISNSNIHVTASQKTTWSGKQDAISDLATIRSGAAAGATAVQPSAISDMATQTWVGNQGFLKASDIAGKADLSEVYTQTQADNKFLTKAAGLTYREIV